MQQCVSPFTSPFQLAINVHCYFNLRVDSRDLRFERFDLHCYSYIGFMKRLLEILGKSPATHWPLFSISPGHCFGQVSLMDDGVNDDDNEYGDDDNDDDDDDNHVMRTRHKPGHMSTHRCFALFAWGLFGRSARV